MAKLPLTFACGLYDRVLPLSMGEVRPEGIDLTFIANDFPGDLFPRMIEGKEFDASEMSCAEFIRLASRGDSAFVGIPVFPSRLFRHGMICVRRDSGITEAKSLEGRQVGTPRYAATAAVWIRGHLQHEYGVDLAKIRWMQDPGASYGVALNVPVPMDENLTGKPVGVLLDEGEIDAYIGPEVPDGLGGPNVRRLFPNYRQVERDYYQRTHIFPIMHVIVIRRDVYERNPFVAQSLYDALTRAKTLANERMRNSSALRYMVPWLLDEVDEIDEIFGGDAWPYGVEPNRPTLEALMTYLTEQGLIAKPIALADLFVTS